MRARLTVWTLFLLLATVGSSTVFAQQDSRSCRLKRVVGSVKVRRGAQASWSDARVGMPLKQSDAIRTFIESEAELETEDGSIISLNENSTLELTTLSTGSGTGAQTKVNIFNGSVVSDVKKLVNSKSRFDFETPTAVASIRGTKVGFDVTSEETQVKVFEGKVFVAPKGSSEGAEVNTNQMAAVSKTTRTIKIEKLVEKKPEEGAQASPTHPDSSAAAADSAKSSVVDTAKAVAVDSLPPKPLAADSLKQKSPPADTVLQKRAPADTLQQKKAPVDTLQQKKASVDSLQQKRNPVDSLKQKKAPADTTAAVAPRTELRIQINQPAEGVMLALGSDITIKGKVTPPQAQLRVGGRQIKPGSSGEFELTLPAPASPGPMTITADAQLGSASTSISRKIQFAAPATEPQEQQRPLVLQLATPAQGQKLPAPSIAISGSATPGAVVTAGGRKLTVQPSGAFSGQMPYPQGESSFELVVEAVLNGVTRTLSRTVSYEAAFVFALSQPAEGLQLAKPVIPVSGMVTPGAQVSAGGMRLAVGPDGKFSGQIPIPDEETDFELEVKAQVGDRNESVVRTVHYMPSLKLAIVTPGFGMKVTNRIVAVQGRVAPASAQVMANDKALSVTPNGDFSGVVTLPDADGEYEITIEAQSGGQSKQETRMVVFTRANVELPLLLGTLTPVATSPRLVFTVNDRTPGDEITFYRSIDGIRESESGEPGATFSLNLEPGVHDYVVYAADKAGNQTKRLSAKVAFMVRKIWLIRMVAPLSNQTIALPPGSPNSTFAPQYTVKFSIDGLPNDDPRLINEVKVVNRGIDEPFAERQPADIDFEFDVNLKRGVNTIDITVTDSYNDTKTKTFILTVR